MHSRGCSSWQALPEGISWMKVPAAYKALYSLPAVLDARNRRARLWFDLREHLKMHAQLGGLSLTKDGTRLIRGFTVAYRARSSQDIQTR